MAAQKKGGASPYATGSGGVTLERAYGATLLAAVLVGDPVAGLGDDMRAIRVDTQTGPDNPVDDYLVCGENPSTGTSRCLSVGVRRDPTLAPSDLKFVKLLGDYVRIAIDHASELDADRWRLGLALAGPHTGAMETRTLTDLARGQLTNESFRATVAREGATTADVRMRLQHLDNAVDAAVAAIGVATDSVDCRVLTWRVLRALRVLILRMEGDDATDRTHAIGRLRSFVEEPSLADGVFRALCDLLSNGAPRAAVFDEAAIRRALSGIVSFGPSLARVSAQAVFKTCEDQLRTRTSSILTESSTGNALSLARKEVLRQLTTAMRIAGKSGGALLVTGQPDVGKSALSVEAVALLRGEGASVIALSLRDLPRSVLEFEHLLGGPLAAVLGGAAVAPARLIVVDGAEVALEGKADLLTHIARVAGRAGLGVVAVARDDAGPAVAKAIAPTPGKVTEFAISGLNDEEVTEVVTRFPALARVSREPRSRWLATRLGLLEILLRSGAHAALPDGALSEADVFAAVWAQHVRRDEVVVAGEPTPDGREAALVAIARKPFDGQSAPLVHDPLALPSLRSDGLLLPVGPTAAWRAGDDFANDVVRDFATARLLIVAHAENLLAKANGPRWSLRAARLACQTALLSAGAATEDVRSALGSAFDALAKAHGERWADVLWEAIVTLGSAHSVLRGAVPALLIHEGGALAHLLRVVRQRFLNAGLARDVIFVEPIVELLCDQRAAISKLPQAVTEAADEIVAAWLASLAIRRKEDATHPLRCRVRDELLAGVRRRGSEHRIRCLGMLGPDLDGASEAVLRDIARDDPADLNACLEQSFAPISLAIHQPGLLLLLTEAYYIELPQQSGTPGYRHRSRDEGIRRHQRLGGLMSTQASPFYGPFWQLLHTSFPRAVVVINRILNHAARYRVAPEFSDPTDAPLDTLPGLEMTLPVVGSLRFVGDEDVWRWYRGTAVGPYPCISALVALERFVDVILATATRSEVSTFFERLVPILLEGCENLAIPGLLVGTLTRYAQGALLEQLTPWVSRPEIWQLEFTRTTHEASSYKAQGPDPDDQPGRDRRRWTFRDVGYCLVSQALLTNDKGLLASLDTAGTALVDSVVQRVNDARDTADSSNQTEEEAQEDEMAASEAIAIVQGWASTFQHRHFRIERGADGAVQVPYEPPAHVVEGFAPEKKDHERGQQAWELEHVYTQADPATWNSRLVADIATARALEENPPEAGPPDRLGGPVAVAAGALQSAASGFSGLWPEDVAWAVDRVVRSTARLAEKERAVLPWGADQAAVRSLPAVLTLPDGAVEEDARMRVLESVCSLAASYSGEVQRLVAVALRPVWSLPCRPIGAACMHECILEAFRQAARSARTAVGFEATTGSRAIEPLDPDVERALRLVTPRDLLVDRLVAPLVVTGACSRSSSCVREQAASLHAALLDAHLRGSVHDAEHNHGVTQENDRLIAEVLLAGGEEHLLAHVRASVAQANALDGLLRELTSVATNDASVRPAFRARWARVMDAVLDAIGEGRDVRKNRYGGLRAFALVVPSPTVTRPVGNIDATLKAAAAGWPTVAELAERIERWLPLAAGSADCVDALVGFLETTPLHDQARRLPWVARIVSADFGEVANRSWLLYSWLERLRASGTLDADGLREYQRLVDGLVAAGDSRALRLQLALE